MKYCIQCKDHLGNTGTFGYDHKMSDKSFHRITPLFTNLVDFYLYCDKQKIELDKNIELDKDIWS